MSSLPSGLVLDLLGTFVFALSGATVAVRRRLDVFGILVLAVAAGLAGGLIRDVVLGAAPPAAFEDARYLLAALSAGAAVFFGHRLLARLSRPVMVLDAIGLGLFAVAGCRKALLFGLDPLPAVILGVLTAIGGGALRDLLVAEVPRVLREEVYALAALLGASVVVLGARFDLPEPAVAATAIALTFVVRVVSVWRGWQAPRAPGS
jgi:uncharacterized membrane protein YeiH